jgi:hypothetical protein
MSYRAEIFGKEHTVADEIFDDETIVKYEAGDLYFVELYNQINEVFPEKYILMEEHRRPERPEI